MSRSAAAAVAAAAALVVATLARYGIDRDGAAWAAAQVVLVALASIDLRERRIPNAIVLPLGLGAIALRLVFERSRLVEILVAGAAAFAVFLLLALLVRGGVGMGDVKLAAAEGLLLGRAAAEALLLGVVVAGAAAVLLLVTRRARRNDTYAYGPYLVLGAVVAILLLKPAALV